MAFTKQLHSEETDSDDAYSEDKREVMLEDEPQLLLYHLCSIKNNKNNSNHI
jgi:hypothetical protein